MRFTLLGPVSVADGGQEIVISRAQRRAVLAYLLLNAGRVVSSEQLVDALWSDDPPGTAKAQIHAAVSAIRQALREDQLSSTAAGYRLAVEPGHLDLAQFTAYVADARAAVQEKSPAAAAQLLRSALELWQGTPLAGITAAFAEPARTHLNEQYLGAVELLAQIELELGHYQQLVPELSAHVTDHPLREKLSSLLMVALFRSGRKAQALAVYHKLRDQLADELGVDPTPELLQLYTSILSNNVAVPVQAARPMRLLPRDIADFTGRQTQLSMLDRLAGEATAVPATVVIAAIAGTGGAGKTALAVHWAHLAADRFPGGQLYVNLHGYDLHHPLRAVDALGHLLRALGVPGEQVPPDEDAAAAAFRHLVAEREVLIVLDNARSVSQVRPLLPAAPGSMVLITSRDSLSGLVTREGAHRLTVGVLDPGESLELLACILGRQRLAAEPLAAAELAALCGHLPLALRIAACQLNEEPDRPIGAFVQQLAQDQIRQLQVDDDADSSIAVIFDRSYVYLPEAEQQLFRLLSLIPGPDFAVETAAAVLGGTPALARRLLQRLVRGHLVQKASAGRYAMHDLVRLYAAHKAAGTDTGADTGADTGTDTGADTDTGTGTGAATARLFAHYAGMLDAAAAHLYPQMVRLPSASSGEGPLVSSGEGLFADADVAVSWLDSEHESLVAAVKAFAHNGNYRYAVVLADSLRGYLYMRMNATDWENVATAGLHAAQESGDVAGQAAGWLSLASLRWRLGEHQGAIEDFTRALTFAEKADWTAGRATAHVNLGSAYRTAGQLSASAAHYKSSLKLSADLGLWLQASSLGNLGVVYSELGDLPAAMSRYEQALELFETAGSPQGQAVALTNLGDGYVRLGDLDRAASFLDRALAAHTKLGDLSGESFVTSSVTLLRLARGQLAMAEASAAQALQLARESSDQMAEVKALVAVAAVHRGHSEHAKALETYAQALAIARAAGWRLDEATILVHQAETYAVQNESALARGAAEEALHISQAAGYTGLAAQARVILHGPGKKSRDTLRCPADR